MEISDKLKLLETWTRKAGTACTEREGPSLGLIYKIMSVHQKLGPSVSINILGSGESILNEWYQQLWRWNTTRKNNIFPWEVHTLMWSSQIYSVIKHLESKSGRVRVAKVLFIVYGGNKFFLKNLHLIYKLHTTVKNSVLCCFSDYWC